MSKPRYGLPRKNLKRVNELDKLSAEFVGLRADFKIKTDAAKLTWMAKALWIATEGTRLELSARIAIEEICPEFFKEEGGHER